MSQIWRVQEKKFEEIAIHFDQYTSLDEDLYKELFCENHKHFDDKNGFSQPKDLQSMIKDPNFFMIPSTVVNKTGGEILLMCLKNALQSHLGITQIMDLFKLINSMFHQPILPNSKYYLDKILSNNCDVKLHSICSECKVLMGIMRVAGACIQEKVSLGVLDIHGKQT
uniref:Uncharacterized protein n=1 Tax=Trichogramma kaykai TaxID=54128 RepID=A0ABD2VV70_9HYME